MRINRPSGLALSSPSAITDSLALADGPQPAAMPAVVDFQNWARLGPDGFFSRYDALRNAAAEESHSDAQAAIGKAPQVNARMALARFLAGSELEFEAIGVLDLLAKTQPQMLSDKEFRGLRGAVKAMAGRYDDASGDFAAPVLAADPSAALWRGYIASKMGRWTEARQAFPQGYAALAQFSPDWKARFTRADAEAAINLNDIKSRGGNITLTGQIFSTGAVKVLAFNGQPSLNLTNNSTWKLATGAIDLALAKAREVGADLVIANDPDADRCAAAVNGPNGGWRMLRGDELGIIFGEWIARSMAQDKSKTGAFGNSIVSSSALSKIAAHYVIDFKEVLTGFKWLAKIEDLAFGYEEAIGIRVIGDN